MKREVMDCLGMPTPPFDLITVDNRTSGVVNRPKKYSLFFGKGELVVELA
jgi:hypothetical protein